jgi:hypothetical protein
MVAFRSFVYVHFARLDGFIETADVASAKECIREMYPNAVFSSRQFVGDADVIVAWADPERRMRHLMGEDTGKAEPDAYVICQVCPFELMPPAEVLGCSEETRARV